MFEPGTRMSLTQATEHFGMRQGTFTIHTYCDPIKCYKPLPKVYYSNKYTYL